MASARISPTSSSPPRAPAAFRRATCPAISIRRDGQHGQEAGHAWAEAWVEDLGWVAFDPLNGISTDDAYVRVACGLDYRDAAPIAGARSGGGGEELAVEVRVSAGGEPGQAQRKAEDRGDR